MSLPQDDANLDLNTFRERFGDVPQKSELTLLCPLKEDPTEKVGVSLLPPWCAAGPHMLGGDLPSSLRMWVWRPGLVCSRFRPHCVPWLLCRYLCSFLRPAKLVSRTSRWGVWHLLVLIYICACAC